MKALRQALLCRQHRRVRLPSGGITLQKYIQVQQDKLVSDELCLRYWDRDSSFWKWVALPISSAVPPNLLRGREQAMIQTLQPPLMFPFVARWFCPKKGIIRPPNASRCFPRQTDWISAHPTKTS